MHPNDLFILIVAGMGGAAIAASEVQDWLNRRRATRLGYLERIGFLVDPEKPSGPDAEARRNSYQLSVWREKRVGWMPWRLTPERAR